MITEIVRFKIDPGLGREEVVRRFESTMLAWSENPKLVRKYYLYDEESGIGGGVYLWTDKASAQAAHDAAWCDRAEQLYGSRPTFEYFETPCIVDNSEQH
ncbi:hypothetical protein M8756_14400 [Lutimaribacter sp. EGI FJ00015]|uniref:Uncharacterized protein n=1 Tax=Lutimaribacter degradans TaxID=2945989 RepID=A0ACC5ZZ84_9RHOB|nr:hypothetical protein [Lutimaribacter sp. EGI FJ00013]MCM2563415.1 hypothetical protein [Lutimaribacter sp. EGI FJ00013]MCO0614507.1 hypothetical protein [Lutimaribacter sp. EGI FJ00015]MCO0637180.1 hypothetical protein [Lutimaribacter sp. EGI FJ00014]